MGVIWEPEQEQETSFGGGKLKRASLPNFMLTVCTQSHLSIIKKPRMQPIMTTLDAKEKKLYFKGRDEPLTNEDGKVRAFGKLRSILFIQRLSDLSFIASQLT